jgi:hypothetical protein
MLTKCKLLSLVAFGLCLAKGSIALAADCQTCMDECWGGGAICANHCNSPECRMQCFFKVDECWASCEKKFGREKCKLKSKIPLKQKN